VCLECDTTTKELFVAECDDKKDSQKWTFEKPDLKALANWDNVGPK